MILRAYLIKNNGEPIYGRTYEGAGSVSENGLPDHVRACATLFHSSEGTASDRVYTLEQSGVLWSYLFFESFAVILMSAVDENLVALKKMMISMGRAIANEYGEIIKSWNGNIGEVEGIDSLVDQHVGIDLDIPSDEILDVIQRIIESTLESKELAYAGVLDARGEMLIGNVPENHLSSIQQEISTGIIQPSVDMVPSSIEVMGYSVQMLKVKSVTVAVAAQRDESQIVAARAVSEIADALNSAMAD
ncbi:MAG: hypothetical protein ACXADS_06925 [Candidatus Thorarchaeota archaeon]|jgi:hypothetical protein